MRWVRHRVWTSSDRLAIFIDRTYSVRGSPVMIWLCTAPPLAGAPQFFWIRARWQTQVVGPKNLAGGALVKELGPGEPVRSLAHSRACVFGRATFLALLGLATRPRPRRTEG